MGAGGSPVPMAPTMSSGRTPLRVRGVRIGHAESPGGTTGVTVALFDRAAPTTVDIRGGASCTFDTASLALEATFGRRWAIFLAGGSIFGLDAARGVRTHILNEGGGHRPFANPNLVVPISGATLFDLPRLPAAVPDYLPLGFEAARAATRGPVPIGRVGAGAGATVGKYHGPDRAMPGGLGFSAAAVRGRGSVGALVAVNSVGAIRDPTTGRWLAGARGADGRIRPPDHLGVSRHRRRSEAPRGTNLVLVVTDVALDRRGLARVAVQAHDGLARAVVPAHTATDGDVVFCATTSDERPVPTERYPGALADRLGILAAELVGWACAAGVRSRHARRGR